MARPQKVKKRKTLPDDIDRLSQNFIREHKANLPTKAIFDKAYNEYIGDQRTRFTEESRSPIWENYQNSPYYKEALEKQEKQPNKYRKLEQEKLKEKRKYEYLGRQKEKTVYARSTSITRMGKRVQIYRDAKGRFTKIS